MSSEFGELDAASSARLGELRQSISPIRFPRPRKLLHVYIPGQILLPRNPQCLVRSLQINFSAKCTFQ